MSALRCAFSQFHLASPVLAELQLCALEHRTAAANTDHACRLWGRGGRCRAPAAADLDLVVR